MNQKKIAAMYAMLSCIILNGQEYKKPTKLQTSLSPTTSKSISATAGKTGKSGSTNQIGTKPGTFSLGTSLSPFAGKWNLASDVTIFSAQTDFYITFETTLLYGITDWFG